MDIQLITISELSQKLGGRSKASIYRDIQSGILPRPVKLSGSVYWDRSEIDTRIKSLLEKQSQP
ncbi:AlpA family phage regulatory protein [Tateyamaria omphalii]|uniref:helix-turn-helix transcriptional regulator n=1 Tax=Tateyamaria omphalii TaxID=299262 RepID=UPI001C9A0F4C|nr:AlpA family phage regulatory protein [Tateyamaria omphalii]MBY5934091.1 AlpA family phage regulatory protein [Tateyamaria omphalii]